MTKYLAADRFLRLFLLFFILVAPKLSLADVRMPALFGSHMVLQQEIKIPVWGWADAGEAITVQDTQPVSSSSKRFMRLEITDP